MGRRHNEEFKREAVRMALTSGLTRVRLRLIRSLVFRRLPNGYRVPGLATCRRPPALIWPKRMHGFAKRTAFCWRRGRS